MLERADVAVDSPLQVQYAHLAEGHFLPTASDVPVHLSVMTIKSRMLKKSVLVGHTMSLSESFKGTQ